MRKKIAIYDMLMLVVVLLGLAMIAGTWKYYSGKEEKVNEQIKKIRKI